MIAPNENTAATPKGNDGVVIANAGRGAVNHSDKANDSATRGATPLDLSWRVTMLYGPDAFDRLLDDIRAHDGDPLICPCHSDPFGNGPCVDCRAEIDAMLVRRGLKPSGSVVDSGDGEPRDGDGEDFS